MTGLQAALLQAAACLGLGAAALKGLGLTDRLRTGERAAWAFALGLGLLGWLVFFLGLASRLQPAPLALLLLAGVSGLYFLPRPRLAALRPPAGPWPRLLLAVLAAAGLLDLAEALTPPADADSLAYHFALAKQFAAAGRIEFVPRAVDGAIPLLVQMTYVPALALGGERGLTLWAGLSGWAAAWPLYLLARRHLDAAWALAVVALFMTAPAMLYGGGSGQVEARLAAFAVAAAVAAGRAARRNDLRLAVLAGLLAGFYAGTKYLGLLFVAAAGVAVLLGPGWLRRGVAFGLAALLAGGQWYGWNWTQTGDPLFPMLFGRLPYADPDLWDARQAAYLKENFFGSENAVPANLAWFVLYPFVATLGGPLEFDSGRVGFGSFPLLVLPFALLGAWRLRDRVARSPLLSLTVVVFVYYVLWFFTGPSQRVRHLLPVLPLLLVCLMAAARRGCETPALRRPLGAAVAATLALQLGGAGLFSLNYLRHLATGEGRDAFLMRNVNGYGAVPWLNANLKSGHRLAILVERQITYLVDAPAFFAHPAHQKAIGIQPWADDPARFLAELRRGGFTHVYLLRNPAGAPPGPSERLVEGLKAAGCAVAVHRAAVRHLASRTVPGLQETAGVGEVVELADHGCALPAPGPSGR